MTFTIDIYNILEFVLVIIIFLLAFINIILKRVFTQNTLISNFLSTHQGRQKLAQAMINPIRRPLDYQSIARKIFTVDQLPQGALPIYKKDDEDE